MTKDNFLALCSIKANRGFRVYYESGLSLHNKTEFRVLLDPGVGFPSSHAVLYRTVSLSKAVEHENRYNMWLIQAGMKRPAPENEVKAV